MSHSFKFGCCFESGEGIGLWIPKSKVTLSGIFLLFLFHSLFFFSFFLVFLLSFLFLSSSLSQGNTGSHPPKHVQCQLPGLQSKSKSNKINVASKGKFGLWEVWVSWRHVGQILHWHSFVYQKKKFKWKRRKKERIMRREDFIIVDINKPDLDAGEMSLMR